MGKDVCMYACCFMLDSGGAVKFHPMYMDGWMDICGCVYVCIHLCNKRTRGSEKEKQEEEENSLTETA